MHRATVANTLHRAYDSGGCRTIIDKVDDDQMMQEMSGNFMKGESRSEVESPQNYGFSSVVRPAKKGKDGQIEESAEGFISFMGGNRSFPVCAVMDDRRYRPRGLKPGENSQYDDLGQMTLMRRNGLFMLSLDSEDPDEQESSSGGGATTREGESGGGQKKERMISMRHVEKKKQPSGKDGKDFKHEGEEVNTEIRCTKKKVQILDGGDVVAVYDKEAKTWTFTANNKITLQAAEIMVEGSSLVTLESGRIESVGTTFLGLGSTGENGETVMTLAGPAAAAKAKV